MVKKRILFFTGAGISQESGMMTFRGKEGIWDRIDPEKVASIRAWNSGRHADCNSRRQAVLDFFNPIRRQIIDHAPNDAHRAIAALENEYDVVVVTQNGDDFHTRAGSSQVIYLHGEALKNCSTANPHLCWEIDRDNPDIHIGDKAPDGSQVRPYVIFFGENIDKRLWQQAVKATRNADIFVIVGSTMLVYPAAELIAKTRHDCKICIIDPQPLTLPPECNTRQFTQIQATATAGMHQLTELLPNW